MTVRSSTFDDYVTYIRVHEIQLFLGNHSFKTN